MTCSEDLPFGHFSRRSPAVTLVGKDGAVLVQNRSAGLVLGDNVGRACWQVMGSLAETEGLPCSHGCVAALVEGSLESARHTRFRWRRELCDLWCVPTDELAVCVLCPATQRQPEDWERLTPRELDVLGLVAAGQNTAGIAVRLDISKATVRTHVEHIRTKLGVATRAAMVAQSFRLGLLE